MNKRQRKKNKVNWNDLRQTTKELLKENRDLKLKCAETIQGANQIGKMVDYILANVAELHGVKEADGEDVLGYRIEFDAKPIEEYMKGKKVKAECRDGKYIIGVVLKE